VIAKRAQQFAEVYLVVALQWGQGAGHMDYRLMT